MTIDDRDYYRRRVAAEINMAQCAQDASVAQVHRQLAAAYLSRLDRRVIALKRPE